jgi:hypothetical protein
MTNTCLRLKRSERGEALVVTISIIGLAIIVTAAAFLLRASTGQDTERVASAKVDIATREDTLMRAILQQTATGMLPSGGLTGPSLDWTTIMTNAVNQVAATTYVDPNEVSTLLGPGVIPANMGDPDDDSAPLSIFQGYNQEVPFGGTTGVPNVDSSYNATVEPSKLVWVANPNLFAATPITNPQQFFLGSQVSATGTSSTSPGGRWGKLPYPNIRFGLMRPGDNMVARRVWWRIPVSYQTTLQTIEATTAGTNVKRFPAMPVNYILSVYEIPSQFPITANANIQLGLNSDGSSWGNTTASAGNQVQITGSIYGDEVQLNGGTYSGGISSRRQVNVASSASVAGETFADNTYNDLGVRETKDLARAIGAAPVSVAGDNGKVLLVPLLSGNDFYMPVAPSSTPSTWDLYARPYYHCRIRITISGTNSTLNYQNGAVVTTGTAGAITVQISYLPDTAQAPDAVFGVADSAPGWTTVTYSQTSNASNSASPGSLTNSSGTTSDFLLYTSTATGVQDCNVLEIDLLRMYNTLGLNPAQCYSIYIGCNPSQTPNGGNSSYPNIVIKDADDLTGSTAQLGSQTPTPFTNGLSIVSTQRIYFVGGGVLQNGLTGSGFNTVPWATPTDPNNPYPASSVYAPDVRYGMSSATPQIAVTGQISVSQATSGSSTAINPLSFSSGANNAIAGPGNSYKLNAVSNPRLLPPISRLNLLFTVEKEQTN